MFFSTSITKRMHLNKRVSREIRARSLPPPLRPFRIAINIALLMITKQRTSDAGCIEAKRLHNQCRRNLYLLKLDKFLAVASIEISRLYCRGYALLNSSKLYDFRYIRKYKKKRERERELKNYKIEKERSEKSNNDKCLIYYVIRMDLCIHNCIKFSSN